MKVKIQNYTFNVAQKKVTLTDYSNIRLDSLLLITNVTKNVIIYNFADDTCGGTVATNQVTLIADLTGMLNTDKLQIFYETDDIAITDNTGQSIFSAIGWLKRIAKLLEPLGTQDSANRQKVAIDSSIALSISSLPTLSNVTTVATVNNLGLIANVDPRFGMVDQARVAYNTGIRANLKFT